MTDYVIETTNLTKEYGCQPCVRGVNLHVKKGRIYGLLGRNGAGKTTTMKLLINIIRPTSGEIRIFGEDIIHDKNSKKNILSRIGSLIESPGFYPNLTGTENLAIFATLRNIPRQGIKAALEVVNLPAGDKKLYAQYSLGMKQRLAISLAIMHDPELLILDEPINGLDPVGIVEMRHFIKALCEERGKTIIISSHILSEIDLLADDIGIIDHGVLLEEQSLEELNKKRERYINFVVSDAAQAGKLLETVYQTNNFKIIGPTTLHLYDTMLSVEDILRTFVENHIGVSENHRCEITLEDYFKTITGGQGIA